METDTGTVEGRKIAISQLLDFFKLEFFKRDSDDDESIRYLLYETLFGADVSNVWQLTNFERFSIEAKEYDKYIISPHEVQEGVLQCRKCHCRKIFSFSRQVRSGDEPTTVFASCTKCRHHWVE
jgi:hypothetical protein